MRNNTAPQFSKWPADKVERRPIEGLAPDATNARKHSEAQIAQIAESMKQWGWTNPVLVDEGGRIIAGHGRVLAGRQLGFAEVPVMVAEGWTKAQIRAYRIADNKLALNADWDFDLLRDEVGELREMGFDFELTGFASNEIDQLFATDSDAAHEWHGMPEFDQQSKLAFKTIVVHLPDPDAVAAFSKLVNQPLTDKTRFIWFPQQPIERYVDKRYTAADKEAAE